MQISDLQNTGKSFVLTKLVIKLGSSVVVGEGNEIDESALASLADSIAKLRAAGVAVILISSGAVGMGRRAYPEFRARTIPDRQALAAIGQVSLMHAYARLFEARGFYAAQVLLTRGDIEDRRRYLNVRYTLERLLELGAVPVINENDTTTIDELQFGDNDELSALVAAKMNADMLVLLTTVDGYYTSDPGALAKAGNKTLEPVPVIDDLTEEIMAGAGESKSALGKGGMATKLVAARIARAAGIHTVIANGKRPGILDAVLAGGAFRGTYFVPAERHARHAMTGRDRWIAFGRKPLAGRQVVIDDGARNALVAGKKSLLPAGIREVRGEFAKGDLIEVAAHDGETLGKGVVNYSSDELTRIKGMKTTQIKALLGEVAYEEAIHRDNLFMNV